MPELKTYEEIDARITELCDTVGMITSGEAEKIGKTLAEIEQTNPELTMRISATRYNLAILEGIGDGVERGIIIN